MVSRGGAMLVEGKPAFATRSPGEQNLLRLVCGSVAGMALCLSVPLWHQAVVVDTMPLTVFLFALALCLLLRWASEPGSRRHLYAACFLCGTLQTSRPELVAVAPVLLLVVLLGDPGLGRDLVFVAGLWMLGNLVTDGRYSLVWWAYGQRDWEPPLLLAFVPAGLIALAIALKRRSLGQAWKAAVAGAFFFLMGTALFYWEPISSMTTPPADWGHARAVGGFLHATRILSYASYEITHDPRRLPAQLWLAVQATGRQFGWR